MGCLKELDEPQYQTEFKNQEKVEKLLLWNIELLTELC